MVYLEFLFLILWRMYMEIMCYRFLVGQLLELDYHFWCLIYVFVVRSSTLRKDNRYRIQIGSQLVPRNNCSRMNWENEYGFIKFRYHLTFFQWNFSSQLIFLNSSIYLIISIFLKVEIFEEFIIFFTNYSDFI